jgi:hypothetical protein
VRQYDGDADKRHVIFVTTAEARHVSKNGSAFKVFCAVYLECTPQLTHDQTKPFAITLLKISYDTGSHMIRSASVASFLCRFT